MNQTKNKLKLLVANELGAEFDIQELKTEFPDLDLKLLTQLSLGKIDNYQGYFPLKQKSNIPFAEVRLRDKTTGEIVELTRETLWDFCETNNYSFYNLICFILGWRDNFYNYEFDEKMS